MTNPRCPGRRRKTQRRYVWSMDYTTRDGREVVIRSGHVRPESPADRYARGAMPDAQLLRGPARWQRLIGAQDAAAAKNLREREAYKAYVASRDKRRTA